MRRNWSGSGHIHPRSRGEHRSGASCENVIRARAKIATAQDDSSLRAEELIKSTKRREYQQLRAPVDGTVQQLSVTTIGGIVQPAQALMVIVPKGSDIYVEAQVLNKDIGFVREGQPVRVKLEAFPFTDYGLIPATIEELRELRCQFTKCAN